MPDTTAPKTFFQLTRDGVCLVDEAGRPAPAPDWHEAEAPTRALLIDARKRIVADRHEDAVAREVERMQVAAEAERQVDMARGERPSPACAGHESRCYVTWQEAAAKLLLCAHRHPYAGESQEVLCKLAGGCSSNTLRKALGMGRETCPVTEALHRWYTTPGHKAPKKFFIHTEADLPEGLMGDIPATIEDTTALLLDDEVEIYYRKIVALVPDPEQRAELEQADFQKRRALVSACLASEKYADMLT